MTRIVSLCKGEDIGAMNDHDMERLRADLIRRAERIRESKLEDPAAGELLSRTRSQPPPVVTPTQKRVPPNRHRETQAQSLTSTPRLGPHERRSAAQTISGQPDLSDFGKALGWLHESPLCLSPETASPVSSQGFLPLIAPPRAHVHPALDRQLHSRPSRNAMESQYRPIYLDCLPYASPSTRPSTSSSTSLWGEKGSKKGARSKEDECQTRRDCVLGAPRCSTAARAYSVQCLVSGLFVVCDLSVYLGLSLKRNLGSQVSIALIVMAIFGSAAFFHGFIRLGLLWMRRSQERGGQA